VRKEKARPHVATYTRRADDNDVPTLYTTPVQYPNSGTLKVQDEVKRPWVAVRRSAHGRSFAAALPYCVRGRAGPFDVSYRLCVSIQS
jgi:hypothetical protein